MRIYCLGYIFFFLQCFTSNCFISPSQLTVFLVTMECQMVPVSLALVVNSSQTKGVQSVSNVYIGVLKLNLELS